VKSKPYKKKAIIYLACCRFLGQEKRHNMSVVVNVGMADQSLTRRTSFLLCCWIRRLAGNWTKLSSALATTAAIGGIPFRLLGPARWVTSIPIIMVLFFVSQFMALGSGLRTTHGMR
jgi:hypothetical protein